MKTRLIDPREILTTPQACELLSVTRQTLYHWMERGRLKPWMRAGGGSWLFLRRELKGLENSKYVRAKG